MSQEPSHPKPVWMERFGARLMQIERRMNAVDAARHAVAAYAQSAHLEPETAAEIFAGQEPLGRPGAPEAPAEPEVPLDGSGPQGSGWLTNEQPARGANQWRAAVILKLCQAALPGPPCRVPFAPPALPSDGNASL